MKVNHGHQRKEILIKLQKMKLQKPVKVRKKVHQNCQKVRQINFKKLRKRKQKKLNLN